MKRLKILFLTPRFPFPLIGGDRVKSYYLLKHLGSHHDVDLVTFNWKNIATDIERKELIDIGVTPYDIELKPLEAALGATVKSASLLPLEILFFYDKKYKNKVNDLVAKNNYDLVIAFNLRTSMYVKDLNIKKILIAEDCRWIYQKLSYEKSKNVKQKLVRLYEYKRLQHFEPRIVEKFDFTTYVSNDDINSLRKLNNKPNYRLITNGVNIDVFKDSGDFHNRKDIMFLGKLDVWSNVRMVTQIVKEIMPQVHKQIPNAKLNIVGADAPDIIRSFVNDRVLLHENVSNVVPYLQNTRVFLHPHLEASGIQNKLLEAMSTSCPIVTTPTGIRGIRAENNIQVMVGQNSDELARLTIELLTNDKKAQTLGANARKLIEETHTWDVVFKQLDAVIEECDL
jgi:polysaccharide biosynthesis protein PslH